MWLITCFRILLVGSFVFAAWRLGDWQNWRKYYPTILFVMVVNLTASFLTYHHVLWDYQADAVVKSDTVIELINSYIMLPSASFVFLSNITPNSSLGIKRVFAYITLWVAIFSSLEGIDHYIIKGISYEHGWSWLISTLFDYAIFSFTYIHYRNPQQAWLLTLILTIIILVVFQFGSAEIK